MTRKERLIAEADRDISTAKTDFLTTVSYTHLASSCGRTDLYSGSDEKMRDTLDYLKTLPHDLQIYPGHGPASTIGIEVRNNPYMISYF